MRKLRKSRYSGRESGNLQRFKALFVEFCGTRFLNYKFAVVKRKHTNKND